MVKRLSILCLQVLFLTSLSLAQGKFDFVDDKHDFGVVEEGDPASFEFAFTNTGDDTLVLKEGDVRASCGCTTPQWSKDPILPGQKGNITASYGTMGRPGFFNKSVTVFQNGQVAKVLTIKGIVIKKEEKPVYTEAQLKKSAKISIDKKSHTFGKVERGQKVAQTFAIKNTGKDTLKITSSQAACHCITHKLINEKTKETIDYLLPGKSGLLELTYGPSSDGNNTDIITIYTTDIAEPRTAFTLSAIVVESLQPKSVLMEENNSIPFSK